MITYRYRIKDSNHKDWLIEKAGKVNFIWNLTQETRLKHYKDHKKWLACYDLQKIIKKMDINSQTVQRTIQEYLNQIIMKKKSKLSWRSRKKNLGWIPCTNQNVNINKLNGSFSYMQRTFQVWYSRKIKGRIITVSINEDARGRWYINVVSDYNEERPHGDRVIGIDLGCKDQAVSSDNIKYSRDNLTKKYEIKLAMAQRARKKTLIKTVHAKIKNKRKDWNDKTSNTICSTSKYVVIGDIESSKLKKTRMAKSISDAGHYQLKFMLSYKALRHRMNVQKVSEKFSTVTCSSCQKKTGPSGLSALGVRQWNCSECGESHDRDVNAARNILLSAQGIER